MEFTEFRDALLEHFNNMISDVLTIFEVDADKDELWNLYLDSFPDGTNEIYKERREYDCGCCRQFIKGIGSAVVIRNNKMETIWGFETGDATYDTVLRALDRFVKKHKVCDVFLSESKAIGTPKTLAMGADGTLEWTHFYVKIPKEFVKRNADINRYKSEIRGRKDVFKRSLEEITEDAVLTTLELIDAGSIYRGQEWKGSLTEFLKYKRTYLNLKEQIGRAHV